MTNHKQNILFWNIVYNSSKSVLYLYRYANYSVIYYNLCVYKTSIKSRCWRCDCKYFAHKRIKDVDHVHHLFYFTWQLILHFIFHTFYGHVPFCLNFDALLLSVSSQVSLLQIKDFVNILVFLFYASSSSISSSLDSTLRWTTMMIFVCPLGPIKHYTHIIGICIALKDNITHLNINLFIMEQSS